MTEPTKTVTNDIDAAREWLETQPRLAHVTEHNDIADLLASYASHVLDNRWIPVSERRSPDHDCEVAIIDVRGRQHRYQHYRGMGLPAGAVAWFEIVIPPYDKPEDV